MPESIEAATVVILRDTPGGIETLLLRRNSRLGFAGGVWVFPGGRVDADDRRPGDDDLAAARRAAVREAAEEAGLLVDEDDLVPFSHWTPPEVQVKRFATWFFLARSTDDSPVAIDNGEIVDHLWVRPADALGQHAAGEVELLPPTWVTLDLLSRHDDVASALEDARRRPIDYHVTKILQDEDGHTYSMWAGDAGYDAGDASIPGPRHRLNISTTPWRYERD